MYQHPCKTIPCLEVYLPFDIYEFVSWDDDIPNWMKSHNLAMFQTTNQMIIYLIVMVSWINNH